jgi:class 3 adenylate cyclase
MTDDLERLRVQLESESHHRHLTILFTDLSDSTWLSERMEAEVYAQMQDEVRKAFTDLVESKHGTVNQFQGDGLQAIFGNPLATEHDGRHAAEVALAIHEHVRKLRAKYVTQGARDLAVHSGIHTGRILPREGHSLAAARLEIYGSAPGIAKHLSDIAERDEILVSEESLGLDSHFFQTSASRNVSIKGRDKPLAVRSILARTALRTRFEVHAQRGLLPFVGRQDELRRLYLTLARVACDRAPAFVALSAPAGFGKTRLAEEFLQRALEAGWSVARGYCDNELSAEPLQPFVQMLRTRFVLPPGTATGAAAATQTLEQSLTAIDPALEKYLPELLLALSIPTEPGSEAGREDPRRTPPDRAVHAVCALFTSLAAQQRQVLFIDDWQWADNATRKVAYALSELERLPILVLTATRPFDAGDSQQSLAEVLELPPFNDAEADATIGGLLPAADPFVVSEIRRYSGGNPLFIEELCHSVAAGGGSGAGLETVRGGSAWLETLIESRVSRLSQAQRELLRVASVIGNVVPTWLLARLTDCDEGHPLVRGLAAHDLVFPGDSSATLRFKHGITRDVVYGSVGLQGRRHTHRQIATLMRERAGTEGEACEALAYHYAGADEFAEAARYAEIAGDKAMATSSIDAAKTQYRAALQMLDRLPTTPERYKTWRSIVRRLGMATVYDPSRGEAEVFARAVDRAREQQDAAGLAYAEYWLAYVNYALGESRAAVKHCEIALQAAKDVGDARLVAQVGTTLGQALAAAGDYRAAMPLLDTIDPLQARAEPYTRPAPALAFSLANKASILADLGRFEEALASIDEALSIVPAKGHEVEGSVLCWRSGINLWRGHWEAARADALAAHRVAERVKSLYLFAQSRGLGAYADWRILPNARALREMLDSVSWREARDKNLFMSLSYGWLSEVMAKEGPTAQARAYAARALQRIRKHDWMGAAMAARAMARLAIAERNWAAAQRHLGLAQKVAQARSSAHEAAGNELCRAELALAQGERALAHDCAQRADEAFERMGMHWHQAEAARVREAARAA